MPAVDFFGSHLSETGKHWKFVSADFRTSKQGTTSLNQYFQMLYRKFTEAECKKCSTQNDIAYFICFTFSFLLLFLFVCFLFCFCFFRENQENANVSVYDSSNWMKIISQCFFLTKH